MLEDKKRHERQATKLSVFVTTPGGYIEVVHRIVELFRHHYRTVDFVIPDYAFSAGTVLAMSGDAIWMDYYSRLGPIDPQAERGGRSVPALGYLIQYERLLKKAQDGTITLPEVQVMLNFDQAELYEYEQARELSIALLEDWLVRYKFKNWRRTETTGSRVTPQMKKDRANSIAKTLNETERWHVHGYGITMEVLRKELKLRIDDFGENQAFQDSIRGYHSLLDDYMSKTGSRGVIHSVGDYRPFFL